MQAYSQDLRERVLRALARGDRPTEIARRFEVSRIWVYQVRAREQETGVRSSFQIGGHRRSRLANVIIGFTVNFTAAIAGHGWRRGKRCCATGLQPSPI